METDLRDMINNDNRLKQRDVQLHCAKQIASGMNFLHSLNPIVLVILFIFILIIYFFIKKIA